MFVKEKQSRTVCISMRGNLRTSGSFLGFVPAEPYGGQKRSRLCAPSKSIQIIKMFLRMFIFKRIICQSLPFIIANRRLFSGGRPGSVSAFLVRRQDSRRTKIGRAASGVRAAMSSTCSRLIVNYAIEDGKRIIINFIMPSKRRRA